ncbi:VPLPA-CTERM sorting domain-containing protein [Litorivita sp. NS0012-18]|uniref:VPLPA-CTERM sorting domain-containing protein n=1 Tax=Litorivita sp. NS0012-18 TaxID=3127655 RepID=UPI0031059582
MKFTSLIGAAALFAIGSTASAATLTVDSYDTPGGNSGTFTYYDDGYGQTSSGGTLTGGTGDLTDGVIATDNWGNTPSPYVGWLNVSPTLTFHFAGPVEVFEATVYYDDSNGWGGVYPLNYITASTATESFGTALSDPSGGGPLSHTISFSGGLTDYVTLTLSGFGPWIMVSEVTFDGAAPAVPVPASLPLLLGAFGGFAALRRRKANRA